MSEERVGSSHRRHRRSRRFFAAALMGVSPAFALAAAAQEFAPAPAPAAPPSRQPVVRSRGMEMKVRRLSDSVEVVLAGVGAAPQLFQTTRGAAWEGRVLTPAPVALRMGPQRLSLPEAGLQSISLEGAGTSFSLLVTPVPGYPVGRPVVSADGRDLILTFTAPAQPSLQTSTPSLTAPGRVAQPSYVPPLQPRAVAPPVGDMAVGSMLLGNSSYVNVSGPPVTMTLKNAPAKDVLMALSRLGGYGFVYVDDAKSQGDQGAQPNSAPQQQDTPKDRPISISFRGESYARAINSALLAAGLQGKLEGGLIMAGPNVLSKTFGAQMSKVYRLNQASADSAADYLANLGARVNKTFTTTSLSQETQSSGTPTQNTGATQSQFATITQIQSYGASEGPLKGLIGTTDSRLGTITLVGDPRLVAVAEAYLKQLDLRQRQVALSLKILDVDLNNDALTDNSFAYRWGNSFIVNDSGQLLGAFGRNLPPTESSFNRTVPEDTKIEIDQTGKLTITARDGIQATGRAQTFPPDIRAAQEIPIFGSGVSVGNPVNPGINYPSDNFYDFVRAQIISNTTKVLASPTLILQENPSLLRGDEGGGATGNNSGQQGITNISLSSPIGRRRANEGVVRVGTNVVTGYDTETPSQGGNVVCTPQLTTAGLVLGARVEKIDDNGFVTFTLSPSISAVTDEEDAPLGCGSKLKILSVRSLDTGAVRVRDGQTLILTGVISDLDREEVKKWPVVGDLPLVGQFFRSSGKTRQKRELVILVTPRIINDADGGAFGYGWQPATPQSRELMRNGVR
ncbi:MAG: secretin N-terminal domain-containing protein [Synechococcaceae cyanobacterium]|nr:secretin N-terminal domain-containing protein [Synechococcaceae cyanobacterium]